MSERPARRMAFRRVAADPRLRRALLAFGAFSIGEFGTWVTILVYAHSVGGASMVGLVAVAQLVPAAVLAPVLAGGLARIPRSRAVTVAYGAQALALGLTATAMYLEAVPSFTIALAVAANVTVALGRPAHNSLVPELVQEPSDLTAANVATTSIENLGVFAGPALAGAVMAFAPPAAALMLLTVGLSVGAWITVGIPRSPHVAVSGTRSQRASDRSERLRTPGVKAGMAVGGIQQVGIGALDVLIVVLAIDELGIGEAGAGYLNAALGLGGVAGGLMAATMVGRARLTPAMAVGVGIRATAMISIGWMPWAAPLLAAAGFGYSVVDVANRTLLQRLVPVASLTRVFGMLEGLTMAGLAIGSAAAPLLVGATSVTTAFPLVGLVLPALLVVVWRPLQRAEMGVSVPTGALSAIRSTEMFAALAPPSLEALARRAVDRRVEADTVIVVEGEPGDRMWVIASGTVEVSRGGVPVKTLHRGDLFGEIALLSDAPRIATVRSIDQVHIFEIDRAGFLDTIATEPGTREALEDLARLRRTETMGE